ncbi:hypothetical protein PIB30_032471 [Stylosanthes scabra]|uniref:Uncharacterized protein n=1 Tax=Stylosanthes scabra TaxID=79078 RepID=A0ABU6TBX7_9FABA|nr:hypothetical protein [Stylosanthes scabra]
MIGTTFLHSTKVFEFSSGTLLSSALFISSGSFYLVVSTMVTVFNQSAFLTLHIISSYSAIPFLVTMSATMKQTSSSTKKDVIEDASVPQPILSLIRKETNTVVTEPTSLDNPGKILLPFSLEGKTHCFLGPLMSLEEAEDVKSFFPFDDNLEPLIHRDICVHAFVKGKPFRKDPKTLLKNKELFKDWFERIAPSKIDFWKSHGVYELMKLSVEGI